MFSTLLLVFAYKYCFEYAWSISWIDVLMSTSIALRSSPPKVFLQKGILKKCSKFTGEHLVIRTPLKGCFCALHHFSRCALIFSKDDYVWSNLPISYYLCCVSWTFLLILVIVFYISLWVLISKKMSEV